MIIRDPETLPSIENAWWKLWERDPLATPFQSPAWLAAWWRAFSPGPLQVHAIWRGNELAALAPLYLEETTGRLLPLRISLSDRLDILCGNAEAAAELRASLPVNKRIEFENVGAQANVRAWAGAQEHVHETSPVLSIGTRWDAHVPARKKRQWRRSFRAAERHGDLCFGNAEDASTFLTHLFALHGARWEQRGERGLLSDERVRRFHRIALPALVQHGLARLYEVYFAGGTRGAYYGLSAKGRTYAYLGGFDPDFAVESPGTLLIAHALQQAAQENIAHFDFLRGAEAYKYAWGAGDIPLYRRVWS